jgi:hypothetical protein
MLRYTLQEDPKCLVKAKLEGKPYTHLAWCSNDVIVGALSTFLHYISAETGAVREVITDAHGKTITGLTASGAAVMCGSMNKQAVVASCGSDHKTRIWVVPSM